ncbi:MAG: alanine--glyoxylate aminotransferase family protein [Vulcanimicrobiaceae bacterium]
MVADMAKHLLFIPGPVTCAPAVLEAMAGPMIDHRGPAFAALLGRVSAGMKPIFGTASDVVVLGSSGTGGLEAAVANMFSPGQKVLSCPVGVFGKRLATIAKLYGLDVEMLEVPLGSATDPEALADRLRADRAHEIAGVLLTHNETSTGVQNDMAALSRAIGDHPAAVVVDSVSGLGASDFQTDAWGFDIVVTASQKALAVPPGLAMLAVSPRAWERIAASTSPRFYLDLLKARDFAALGQTPWTPPISVAYALDVAIERYHAEGARRSYARHERYRRAIHAFAAATNVTVFSKAGAHSVTVVAMHVPAGLNAAAIRSDLSERHGVVLGGGQAELKGKIVRMGTMGDLSSDDMMRGFTAIESVLEAHGHAFEPGSGTHAARSVLDGELVVSH